MGLQTTEEIPYGKTFGPISRTPGSSTDAISMIGQNTKDNYPDQPITKISPSVLEDPNRIADWLTHINPARNEKEQNMEVYCKEGNIYYRALRTILADEEILAWYSRDLAASLGIPDINNSFTKENGDLRCPMCDETYRQPFALRAHITFQCSQRQRLLQQSPLDMTKSKRQFDEQYFSSMSQKIHTKDKINSGKESVVSNLEHAEKPVKKRRLTEECSSGDEDTDRNQNIRSKNPSPPRVIIEQFSPSSSYQTSPEISPVTYHNLPQFHAPNAPIQLPKSHTRPFLPYPDPYTQMDRMPNDIRQEMRQLEANALQNRLLTEMPYMPYPTLRMQNPILNPVEKLLSVPPVPAPVVPSSMLQMNLLQNWCAKCNATFRMTSDLVYHMRSHHKREFDPVKRKRDEKLKCTICHESFKERHHLTRHMTSHL